MSQVAAPGDSPLPPESSANTDMVSSTLLRAIAGIGARPNEDEQSRLQRGTLVTATLLISLAGLMWGIMYTIGGEPLPALIPGAYALISLAHLDFLRRTRRIEVFRMGQILMTLLLPFLLMLALGGFVQGSAVILWAFMAPLGALLCWDERSAIRWFAAFLALNSVAAMVNPLVARENGLAEGLRLALFVLNIGGPTIVAFIVLMYFVRRKDLVMELAREKRELERANLEQELLLRQSEKLATLGRLSAGVAHELNNPAAAVQRAASHLTDAVARLSQVRFSLGQAVGSGDRAQSVLRWHAEVDAREGQGNMDPLERSDREEALVARLSAAGVDQPWAHASVLVDLGVAPDAVASLAQDLAPDAFEALLGSLTSSASARQLLGEIGSSAGRISEIVKALKTYTYMDKAPVQFLDVNEGLDNTLVMLAGKLKRGVEVEKDYDPDLPDVEAYGGELNQVWTNIIDNAVDAMDGEGELRISTRSDGNAVTVEITDSGPGIPSDVLPHVFDPFFTTKPMGEGTGLGLNISYNIVCKRHGGEIRAESRPGETRFLIKLPIRLKSSRPGDDAPSDVDAS